METQILSPSGGPPYFLWPLTWVSVVLVAFNQISRACTRSRFSTWCGNKIEPAQIHHLHVYYQVSPKYFVFSIYDMQSHKAAHPFAKFPWYRFECVHMNEVLLAASDQSHWLLYQQQMLENQQTQTVWSPSFKSWLLILIAPAVTFLIFWIPI